ncbi:MAG: hypothetical protein D6701_09220 [Gemmatimonadetes bacterium]|nr:MAG: hypothetical protein D6701_09220 [Gemmatimonadota bacterium]
MDMNALHAGASAAGALAMTVGLALASPPPRAVDAAPVASLPQDSVVVCLARRLEAGREVRVEAAEARRLLREEPSYEGPCAVEGPPVTLGGADIAAYAQLDDRGTLYALGVRIEGDAFDVMPRSPHDGNRCLDVDQDGRIDMRRECVGGHERVVHLPEVRFRAPVTSWVTEEREPTFRWVLFNWNPAGHGPPGVYDVPHIDVHFFIQSLAERNRIRIGPCALLVDCEDLEKGKRPVPERFVPPGYEDHGVVEFGMGNHLLDAGAPELAGAPFTHTFIYGSWDGRISFLEPMIAVSYLEGLREGRELGGCFPVRQPEAWAEAGVYPTSYCIRYRPARDEFSVSIEGFRAREAG